MKELFKRLKTFNIEIIFHEKTTNIFVQLFRYLFVGGFAFLSDFVTLIVLHEIFNVNVYIAAAFAFIIGLITNFILSKLFVFQEGSQKTNAFGEFVVFAIIGVIGLGLTELLMWAFTKIMIYIIAKILASAIVLVWNFVARKVLLYKN